MFASGSGAELRQPLGLVMVGGLIVSQILTPVSYTHLDVYKRQAQQIITRLQQRAAHVPGIALYLQPVQELSIEDRISRTQYQFTLTSPDFDELSTWAPRLIETLQAHPALADVASDLQNQGLQAHLQIDRNAAARLGIPVSAIADALYDAFGQRRVSTIFTQANQYRVVLELSLIHI